MISFHLSRSARRGSALGLALLLLLGMSGLALGLLRLTLATRAAQRRDQENAHARYVAQAGLARAMASLQSGHSGVLGASDAPLAWGQSQFYVTQEDLSSSLLRLTATGLDDRAAARQELVLRRLSSTMWQYGLFGRESVGLASNALVDSYDSRLGSYASQAVNGSGAQMHAGSGGNVGSNGDIVLEENTRIFGDAIPGPQHTATILDHSLVTGSSAPAEQPLDFPALSVPTLPSSGPLTVGSALTLAAGDRSYSNLTISSNKTLTITGPANVVIRNLTLRSGARIQADTSGGDVTLWVLDNCVIGQGGRIAPVDMQSPHLRLNLLSDNVINPELAVELDHVEFQSNSSYCGTLYAPNAEVSLNSNFELFGSMIARQVRMRSNTRVHFDVSLLDADGGAGHVFETVAWREIPLAR